MPKKTKTFDRFNLVRRIAREMFVNGYRGYSEYLDTISVEERRYSNHADWIKNCLYNCVQWPERGRKWFSYDQMRISANPLNRLYQANKMSNAFSYALFFALCHMLQDGKELSLAGITKLLDEQYDIASKEEKSKVVSHLNKYVADGWLKKCESGQYRLSEWLPISADQKGLFDRYPKLVDAVTFFAEQSALGIIGSQILDLCEYTNDTFVFKHKYIAQVLDAIVLNDVLHSIQSRKPVQICAEQTSSSVSEEITALPIKVLSSTLDGRQYVLIFDLDEKRYRSIRLDYIEGISPSSINKKNLAEKIGKTIEQVFAEGNSCIQTIWSSTVRAQALHVSVLFEYDAKKEGHIRNRIYRETRGKGEITEEQPGRLRYVCDVDNPLEMTTWLLSLTGYIKSIEADDRRNTHRLKNRFFTHVKNQYDIYHSKSKVMAFEQYELQPSTFVLNDEETENKQEIMSNLYMGFLDICDQFQKMQNVPCRKTRREIGKQISNCIRKAGFDSTLFDAMVTVGIIQKPVDYEKHQAVSDEILGEWRKLKDTSGLFSGINSCYVYVYRYVLRRLNKPATQARIQSLIDEGIQKFGFEDSYNDISFKSMFECGMIRECASKDRDASGRQLYEAYMHIPSHGLFRPLTNVELCWIRAILDEPQMLLFLEPDDIEGLKKQLVAYKPLYRADDIICYDAYTDGDAYCNRQYIENFRRLCDMIHCDNSPVKIAYIREKDKVQRRTTPTVSMVYPLRMEYSKRDDKFRLLAYEVHGQNGESGQRLSARGSGLLPLRLSNIVSVSTEGCEEIAPMDCEWSDIAKEEVCKEPIEVRVAGKHRARERFMIAFMPYRKEVQYSTNTDDCRVRIWYSTSDVKELLAALRSYGDAVEVLGPKKIRADIVKRVDKQYAILSDVLEDRV